MECKSIDSRGILKVYSLLDSTRQLYADLIGEVAGRCCVHRMQVHQMYVILLFVIPLHKGLLMAIKQVIRELAARYAQELKGKMDSRVDEMEGDDKSHYLIYFVLGVLEKEGKLIDVYQNKGRFLYKYAGAFLEEATFLCFKEKYPQASKVQVENTLGKRPKQFEIDCLIGNDAIEIKWRDATTDGDHITKEHTRIRAIKGHGFKPIRVMFYYPNRDQAIRIQDTLKTVYDGVGGEYYAGEDAWIYIRRRTGVDLKAILTEIAKSNQKPKIRK
jgi:hypothetical protein